MSKYRLLVYELILTYGAKHVHTIKKNREVLLVATKEDRPSRKCKKKCTHTSGEQKVEQNYNIKTDKDRLTHSMPCPCRAAKGLECVFPIWFTQCGRVWFTLAMPRPCHALTMPFFSRPRHSATVKTACGAASVQLPATTRSSKKIVIRSIPIWDAGGQYETQRSSWTRKSLLF